MSARLVFRFDPATDLYLLLTDAMSIPADGWTEAWDAIRPVLTTVADAGLHAAIAFHGTVAEATSIDELEALHGSLSDVDRDLGLPWRDLVGQTIEALRIAQPLYDGGIAAARRDSVATARSVIDSRFGPVADDCLAYIESSLELPTDGVTIPVRLVASSFRPGAFTSRSMRTGAACFVGVNGLEPGTLIEMVLHEAIHALDELSPAREASVLWRLDRALDDARLSTDRRFEQVTHSMYFVQAAETVRRFIEREHVHYGVTHTYYDRVPPAKIVLRHWTAHLDGAGSADAAIDAIVAELSNLPS